MSSAVEFLKQNNGKLASRFPLTILAIGNYACTLAENFLPVVANYESWTLNDWGKNNDWKSYNSFFIAFPTQSQLNKELHMIYKNGIEQHFIYILTENVPKVSDRTATKDMYIYIPDDNIIVKSVSNDTYTLTVFLMWN